MAQSGALHSWTAKKELFPFTHLLQQLLLRVAGHVSGDKYRLSSEDGDRDISLDLLDFLAEVYRIAPNGKEVGGAAAHMARLLSGSCHEPDVVLWTAFHSPEQASAFDERTQFLKISDRGLHSSPARQCGREGDPDVRNFPFEVTTEELSVNGHVIKPGRSSRVIVVAPGYLHYLDDGRVDRDRSTNIRTISRLPTTPEGESCVDQVGDKWKHWIIINLQRVSDPGAQKSLEDDLRRIPQDVTVHVEISGADISSWFRRVLCKYVDSVGVNTDELVGVVQKLSTCTRNLPFYESDEVEVFDRALWLACELELDRLYVHGHHVDLVVRSDPLGVDPSTCSDEMAQEVRAGLFAKAVVIRQASETLRTEIVPGTAGLEIDNVWRLAELYIRRGQPLSERGSLTISDLLSNIKVMRRGWFEGEGFCDRGTKRYPVAMIPVSWMEAPSRTMRTAGLRQDLLCVLCLQSLPGAAVQARACQ